MLTIEQAIQNIQVVLDNYIGKKADHIALQESIDLIKTELTKSKE